MRTAYRCALPRLAAAALAVAFLVPSPAQAEPPADAAAAKAPAADGQAAPADPGAEGQPGAAGEGDAAANPEPPPPPPPPKPGYAVITSDADGLTAEVAGTLKGLKVGETRVELQPGDHKITVTDKDKKVVATFDIKIEPEGEAKVSVVTRGQIVVPTAAEVKVKIDGKDVAAADGKVSATLPAGPHSVVVTQTGMVGAKASVDVAAGKTHMITAGLKPYDAGSKPAAWAAIIGGGGLILAGVLLEAFADRDAVGGDATRWSLVGVGTAGFVGGTILMKDILKKEANPPIEEGGLTIKLAATPRLQGAAVAMRF